MSSTEDLTRWLTGRTAGQLTVLLERRQLPYAGVPGLAEPARLAAFLLGNPSVRLALTTLNLAELQVLSAVAVLAERRYGPAPAPAVSAPAGFAGRRIGAATVPALDPASRPVPRAELLELLGSRAAPLLAGLADRALLLPPHGEQLAVPAALHQQPPYRSLDFTPEPPPLPAVPLPAHAAGAAQAAVTEAAARVELLLRATAAGPPALRRTGGPAVREVRGLAKAAGLSEPHAALWLDLAANAGLLAPSPAPLRLLPTARYDHWAAGTPAERLAPLLAAWAVTPLVFGTAPAVLGTPNDPTAVPLRHALLLALDQLPPGHGGVDPAELLDAAAWHRPLGPAPDPAAAAATLAEAELLGVLAHGAPTPVGRAVRELLDTGAAHCFPAVPPVRHLCDVLDELMPPQVDHARFQADLTAVVTGPPTAALARLLDLTADRESDGQATVWRFSPAAVRRALDTGLDADELLGRLRDRGELPQPLEYLVKDTARTHGRLTVAPVGCVLRSEDEALVLELTRARALSGLGLHRIAPTVLTSTADAGTTLTALRQAGYAPSAEAVAVTVERAPTPPDRAPADDAAALAVALLGAGTSTGN
ncbi:helicase-associated domain-containing protein [Kitasatospora sp. NBC_00070]|uniref:helicase-associated domain-containing protein n=1 Tax=Kitasatospora sp. NBC_00070 TaxID=2975962 RepID=UPI00324A9040